MAGLQASWSISEYPALVTLIPFTPCPPSPFTVLRTQSVSPASSASLPIAFPLLSSSSVEATCASDRSESDVAVEDGTIETFCFLDGGASELPEWDRDIDDVEAAARCMN